MRYPWLVVVVLAAACAGEPDGDGSDADAYSVVDAATARPDGGVPVDAGSKADGSGPMAADAQAGCAAIPAPAPSWLRGYHEDLVGRLAAGPRARVEQRTTTRELLQAEFQTYGYAGQLQQYAGDGANVWAELPATEGGSQYVVVGAHFDSVSDGPGANDNATGVAIVLALARYLSSVECRDKNVIFALFDQEEVGLIGSYYFAHWLVDQGYDVVGVHTIDQIGWDDDDDRAIELERADPGMVALYRGARDALGMSVELIETSTGSTDHVRFREVGFSAIGLTEGYVSGDTTPHYHTKDDTPDTVDFEYMVSTSTLLHYTVARFLRQSGGGSARVAPAGGLPAFRRVAPRR